MAWRRVGGAEESVTEQAVALRVIGPAQFEAEQWVGGELQEVAMEAEFLGQGEIRRQVGAEQVPGVDTGACQALFRRKAHGLHGLQGRRQGLDMVGNVGAGSHMPILATPVRNSQVFVLLKYSPVRHFCLQWGTLET